MNIKVFHLLPGLEIGGAEQAALSSVEEMNSVFVFKLLILNSIKREISPTVAISFNSKKVTDIMPYVGMLSYLRKEKPQIIILSFWRPIFIGILYKVFFDKKVTLVTFRHSTKYKHVIDYFAYRISYQFADYIFADSNSTAEAIKNKISGIDIKVISFLLNKPKVFVGNKNKKFSLLSFIYIGRLNAKKGILKTISFINKLNNTIDIPIYFDIYGKDENYKHFIVKEIKKNKLEKFINLKGELRHEDVYSKLVNYDFFLQFSEYEGMAISVTEAIQVGLIPITTKVGEIPNYTNDMENAVHLDPEDVFFEKLNSKIIKLIEDVKLFNKLSNTCKNTFKNNRLYPESLKLEILDIVKNKYGLNL